MSDNRLTEFEVRVPQDLTSTIHAKLDRVLVILEGRHDADGEHHPGLSHRVKRLENALNAILSVAATSIAAVVAYWALIVVGKHP